MKILFASHNTHKISELRQLLPARVELVSLADFNYLDEIEETGKDLMENAFIKARTVYSLFKLNTIADDTGLEVEALGGAPGVMSARYAGEGFGYDPIFKPDGYNLCFAEMDSATKSSISHRGLAVRQLTSFISKL